jgi:hypothetical protein
MPDLPDFTVVPVGLAFIIDGEVVEVLRTNDRLGAILLSDPVIVDISDKVHNDGTSDVQTGATYNPLTSEFTNPE